MVDSEEYKTGFKEGRAEGFRDGKEFGFKAGIGSIKAACDVLINTLYPAPAMPLDKMED